MGLRIVSQQMFYTGEGSLGKKTANNGYLVLDDDFNYRIVSGPQQRYILAPPNYKKFLVLLWYVMCTESSKTHSNPCGPVSTHQFHQFKPSSNIESDTYPYY